MAAFYSLLCKAIKKQPAGRSGRLFWRSGRDSNPRAIARKLISRVVKQPKPPHYIILDLLLNTPVFTGFHKVHTEQMQAGTTSSASSGEKWARQSQRLVVFG